MNLTTGETQVATTGTQPKKRRARVLITDHHPIVLFGLSQLINREPDLCVYATTSNVGQTTKALESREVDLVIIAISFTESSGLDLIKHIRSQFNKVPILVFSMHDDSLLAERVLEAGALGYVMKHEPVESILVAIRRVLNGNVYLSERMKSQLLKHRCKASAKDQETSVWTLTDREFEVLNLIGRGKTVHQIASLLRVNFKTIQTHCAHIMEKLKLRGMLKLMQYAAAWVNLGR